MDFPNLVHTLITILLVLCWRSLQRRVPPKTANVWIRKHICWNYWNTWQQYIFALKHSVWHFCFNNVINQLFHRKAGTIAKSWWIDISIRRWWACQISILERAVACRAKQVNLRIQLNIWQLRLDSLRYRWTGTLSYRMEFRLEWRILIVFTS